MFLIKNNQPECTDEFVQHCLLFFSCSDYRIKYLLMSGLFLYRSVRERGYFCGCFVGGDFL